MKVLKVCTSEFFPIVSMRDDNVIYFVYDKMSIYLGKNFYSDPFCVVEKMPDNPIEGMLYITLDGKVKTYLDYKIIDIAETTESSEIEALKLAGTYYFMKAEYRYLDLQTRTIQLPYQNGNYELAVSVAANLMIDKNTIIRFNPSTNRFEIDGVYNDESNNTGEGIGNYRGVDSNTISTKIVGDSIKSEIIVSPEAGNLLHILDNGLYANLDDVTTSAEFNDFVKVYTSYKSDLDTLIIDLKDTLGTIDEDISSETIGNKILEALENYKPTINDMFSNYDYIAAELEKIRSDAVEYTDQSFEDAKEEVLDFLNRNLSNTWGYFDGSSEDEVDVKPDYMSDTEYSVQAMILEEYRAKVIALRDLPEDIWVMREQYDFIDESTESTSIPEGEVNGANDYLGDYDFEDESNRTEIEESKLRIYDFTDESDIS